MCLESPLQNVNFDKNGIPEDKSYLERGLPDWLVKSIEAWKEACRKLDVGEEYCHWDIDYCNLQSDINVAEVEELISSRQAWHLRENASVSERTDLHLDVTDFSCLPVSRKTYGGGNGKKLSVILDGERYLLKFPPVAKDNKRLSYTGGCFCEHIGCRVFYSVGIPVQETRLGTYTTPKGTQKIVVACKDFTAPGVILQDFAQLKNTIVDSSENGYGTELAGIEETFASQDQMSTASIRERFWDMFI